MTLLETFDSNLGNYSGSPVAPASVRWLNYGNPQAGCARIISSTDGAANYYEAGIVNNTDTYTLVDNAPTLYFNARFKCNVNLGFSALSFSVVITFDASATLTTNYFGFNLVGTTAPYDSGWLQVPRILTGKVIGEQITSITFTCLQSLGAGSPENEFIAYIDTISIGTSAPPFDATAGQLPLKLAAGRYTGGTLSLGSVQTIADSIYPTVGNLSASKAVVAYIDNATAEAMVRVVNKSNLALTLGAAAYSLGDGTLPSAIFALSSTKAVALYEPGAAVILDIAGDVITVGTPVALETGAVFVGGSRLSATKFFISYVTTTVVRGVIATVSGSTITLGTPANASLNNAQETSCVTLVDDTTVIMAYHSAADTIRAVALAITGTTFSIDDDELIDSNVNDRAGVPMISRLDADRVVVTYYNNVTAFDCKAAIVTLAGGVLAPGDILTYSSGVADRYTPAVGALDDATLIAAYWYSDSARAKNLLASGATLTDHDNEAAVGTGDNIPSIAVMKAV